MPLRAAYEVCLEHGLVELPLMFAEATTKPALTFSSVSSSSHASSAPPVSSAVYDSVRLVRVYYVLSPATSLSMFSIATPKGYCSLWSASLSSSAMLNDCGCF